MTLHRLPDVLDGELDPLLDPLMERDRAEKLDQQARASTD